ncbi:MAG: peptidase domain-containing ABC transporter [Pseudomonadota bacterium]
MIDPFGLFHRAGKTRTILQAEAAECALACLAMVSSHHGLDTDLVTLRRRHKISSQGTNLRQLMSIASELGFHSRAVKAPLEHINALRKPAILHWDMDHFVVLDRVGRGRALIHDPRHGKRSLTARQLSEHYTGVALELDPSDDFVPKVERQRLSLRTLCSRSLGVKSVLIQLLVLSLLMQVFVLTSPLFLQLIVDSVLPTSAHSLLLVLAVGFSGFMVLKSATEALRSYVALRSSSLLGFNIASNLFQHLLRLPHDYFAQRHTADVLYRFSSLDAVKSFLVEDVTAAFVDAVMIVTALTVMFIYSPKLALVSIATAFLILTHRVALLGTLRARSEQAIEAKAKESSCFLETVRGIVPLKLLGLEGSRSTLWREYTARLTNSEIRLGSTRIWLQFGSGLLLGIESVICIYLGAKHVLAGGFSVGMLMAFLAYKHYFFDSAVDLMDRFLQLALLRLHLERLSDVALTQQEPIYKLAKTGRSLEGAISLRSVRYRYADGLPAILNGVSLDVSSGESVAISGCSGSGKSTLIRIIAGLESPEDGELLVDGVPLARFGLQDYRSQVASVMQTDTLFSGTLRENITSFDVRIDDNRLLEAAKTADIYETIEAMPMGFDTLIGDMGSCLSGGQEQRVLLARALYQNPKVLLIDEGTSHLDPASESKVNEAIRRLGVTRIIIAHRIETLLSADRVLHLSGGLLSQRTLTA